MGLSVHQISPKPLPLVLIHRPHGSTVLWDNIIKMVSGTDEPLSVGSDEPHFFNAILYQFEL